MNLPDVENQTGVSIMAQELFDGVQPAFAVEESHYSINMIMLWKLKVLKDWIVAKYRSFIAGVAEQHHSWLCVSFHFASL